MQTGDHRQLQDIGSVESQSAPEACGQIGRDLCIDERATLVEQLRRRFSPWANARDRDVELSIYAPKRPGLRAQRDRRIFYGGLFVTPPGKL